MKYIYGLSVSGESIIKYFIQNNISFFVWDDDQKIRNIINKNYKNINFIHPKNLDWSLISEAFISPGIHLTTKSLSKASKHKTFLYRDLELYSKIKGNAKIIAVTGTNGKSTTVKLISDIIKNNKIDCFVGGNFGIPLLDCYKNNINKKFHVIELSSYQLEAAPSFKPFISILLNISEDHQDRYRSMSEYASIKENIFNKKENSYSIVSIDDSFSRNIYNKYKKNNKLMIPISTSNKISNGVYYFNKNIYDNFFGKTSISLSSMNQSLVGYFNYQNILAAYVINKILNLDLKIFFSTIKNFHGLPHRLESIFENDKYLIINNSKSTNIDSSIKTIENFKNVFLILGGRIKNKDFSIFEKVRKKINKCFIIGESTELIFNQVSKFFNSYKSFTLEKAIDQIFLELSSFESKATILLAPACSSFDQFKNFEERGNKFKEIIMKKIKVNE